MNKNPSAPSCAERRDAYFEAGHAVVAFLEGLEIVQLSIESDGGISGWIEIREPSLSRSHLRSSRQAREEAKSIVRALLAGSAAQVRYSFGPHPMEFNLSNEHLLCQETVWRAISIAGKFADDGPALIHTLWTEVTILIQDFANWAAVDAVAMTLLSSRELAGCEVCEIARHAIGRWGGTAIAGSKA